jgi:hypothetical protein
VYGSVVQFFYTVRACVSHAVCLACALTPRRSLSMGLLQFVDRGLSMFTSSVDFTAAGQRLSILPAAASDRFVFVALPLTAGGALSSGAARVGTALRTTTPTVEDATAAPRAASRGLLADVSDAYAQAAAQAAFAPVEKGADVVDNGPTDPVPTGGLSW